MEASLRNNIRKSASEHSGDLPNTHDIFHLELDRECLLGASSLAIRVFLLPLDHEEPHTDRCVVNGVQKGRKWSQPSQLKQLFFQSAYSAPSVI